MTFYHVDLNDDLYAERDESELAEHMKVDAREREFYLVRKTDCHLLLKGEIADLKFENKQLESSLAKAKAALLVSTEGNIEKLATHYGNDYNAEKQSWLEDVGVWQAKCNDLEREVKRLKEDALNKERAADNGQH